MGPLLFLMIALGVSPAPVLERMEPGVQAVLEYVEVEEPSVASGAVGGIDRPEAPEAIR